MRSRQKVHPRRVYDLLWEFDHLWENILGFVEHGGVVNFEHTHLCARRTFLSTVYISPKLGTSFLMGSVKATSPELRSCQVRIV